MSESEQREIEKEALELYPDLPWADTIGLGIEDNSYTLRIGYIAGATTMAEKKNVEIEYLKTTLTDLRTLNESLQREIKILDEALDKHLK